jgi:exodeoxyribonuclease V beta subunit
VPSADQNDIHAFPAGARAGLCLHEVFERLDFADLSGIDSLVTTKLAQYSLDPSRWGRAVADCIRRVLEMTLPGGFSLAGLPARERLAEREFHLPAGRLEARALRRILGGSEEPGGLDFAPREGWLKGFIDLVFRKEGRFYIADWKSNRLGASSAAYTRPAVDAAMASHHYGLQAHLYALALHRYLRQRQRGYEYERHFGGMLYFFVRGADPANPSLGLWHERPSYETIARLEHWLAGGVTS